MLLESVETWGRLFGDTVRVIVVLNYPVFLSVLNDDICCVSRAMFTHNMVESRQSTIPMSCIDSSALESLVNFAYTGIPAVLTLIIID